MGKYTALVIAASLALTALAVALKARAEPPAPHASPQPAPGGDPVSSKGAFASIDEDRPEQLDLALRFAQRMSRYPSAQGLGFEILVCGEGVRLLDRERSPMAARLAAFVAGNRSMRVVACSETLDKARAHGLDLRLVDGLHEEPAMARFRELTAQG